MKIVEIYWMLMPINYQLMEAFYKNWIKKKREIYQIRFGKSPILKFRN